MQKLLGKLFPGKIHWRNALLESALFLAAYIIWVIFRSPQSSSRLFIGSLAILVPGVAAVLMIFQFLPQFPLASQPAWRFLGFGLACWSLGNLVRSFYEAARGIPVPIFSLADVFSILAYPLLLLALILYPFENRYAPSRFRYLLDGSISAGVVGMLVLLILSRSASSFVPAQWIPFVYPIADLILLMILLNTLLANRKARMTLILWGSGFFFFLISDYVYSLLAPVNGYQVGGPENIGWVAGGLLFGWGAVYLGNNSRLAHSQEQSTVFDLGTRLQNILPFAFVSVLVWFVLVEWRITGILSWLGAGACVFLVMALVVRIGVRTGENELHKYWQLFSSMAEPIFICDQVGKILLGNPALGHALGMQDAHGIIGKPLSVIFDPQTLPADLLQRAVKQDCSLEVALLPERTPYLLSLSPIISEGRRVLLAGAAHDLSDQKRQQTAIQQGYAELQKLHRQLENLNTQLEQKVEERTRTLTEAYRQLEEQNKVLQELDQLKSDFVSLVSHELRTPLTSLNGGLELLLLKKNARQTDHYTLVLMKEEVGRLIRFVENILNLSAMEAGRVRLNLLPVSLDKVLSTVCRKFDGNPGVKQIQINLLEVIPLVLADESVLEGIFSHLLDNALKYAPGCSIVVEAIRTRNKVRIQVTDDGPGIPAAKRPLLFQRFQRLDAKDSQSVYGYGLGLYLSQRMLQAMQSDLAFEVPEQGGARFYFYLKVAR